MATFMDTGTDVDSHVAIIGASLLDNNLELAILSKMRPLPRDIKDRIFDGYGPLSTFAGKIDIAFALEIIPREFYGALKTINKVRVKFAHSMKYLTFQDPEISALIDPLLGLDLTPVDRRNGYLHKIAELAGSLEMISKSPTK
jgi:hypothetical protein